MQTDSKGGGARFSKGDLILVTGGAGFIGSHTVDALLERGYRVRILDNLQPRVHPRGKPSWVPAEAEFVLGDVSKPADMGRALAGADGVVPILSISAKVWLGIGRSERPESASSASSHPAASAPAAAASPTANNRVRQ